MNKESAVFDAIKERRSVRTFLKKAVSLNVIHKIIESGSHAPSGHNNQPWRFVVVRDEALKDSLAKLTVYGKIIKEAASLIAVFLDKEDSYDRDKDMMAMGACIQNMLLYAHSVGVGTVWLGEILKNKEDARKLLSAGENRELAAVIALGCPVKPPPSPGRKTVEELMLKEY